MKLFFTCLCICIIQIASVAQTNDRYYIQLSDKNGSPYSISNPSQFLSSRSIARRTNQGIPINTTDLPVNPSYISQIAATGATVLYPIKWFNGVVIQTSSSTVLNNVNNLSFVVSSTSVNISLPNKIFEKYEPLENSAGKTYDVQSVYNYGNSLNQIDMLNGVCMHDLGFNGTGMLIGVIDAGFANADTHPAFDSVFANNQIKGTKDFTFRSPTGLYSGSTSGHGTAVLGTMAGNYPGQLVGTAPKSDYWLIRSEYANDEYIIEEYNWAAAAEFADSVGVDIINSSLGYSTFDDATQDHTPSQLDGKTSIASKAATMCARKGIITVIAAGNSGGSSWPKIGFPGDADSVITVGAVDPSENYAGFSSIGPTADNRIKPDVMAQGSASVVANSSGTVGTSNGTSFASPITAGMVACLWQATPGKKNMEVIDAIRQSASLYNNPNNQFGYGIPDYCAAKNMLLGLNNSPISVDYVILTSANPFTDDISLAIQSAVNNSVNVELINPLGQVVYQSKLELSAQTKTNLNIVAAQLSSGFYTLRITSIDSNKDLRFNTKLIKAE